MSQTETTRVAIITGASSGIGRDLAKELVKDGYRVGVIARRREELEKLVAEIRQAGGTAEFESADVADRTSLISAIHRLAERLGPVDLLVANAGLGTATRLNPPNTEEIEQVIRVNLLGVVYAIEAVLPEMLKRRSGHIAATS